MVPVVALAPPGTLAFIPADRTLGTDPLDTPGLARAALGLERPRRHHHRGATGDGWLSARTITGTAIAAAALIALILVEGREEAKAGHGASRAVAAQLTPAPGRGLLANAGVIKVRGRGRGPSP